MNARLPVLARTLALAALLLVAPACGGGSGGTTGRPEVAVILAADASDAAAGPLDPGTQVLLVARLRGRPFAPFVLLAASSAAAGGSLADEPAPWAGGEVDLLDSGAAGFEDQILADGFLDELGRFEVPLVGPDDLGPPAPGASFEVSLQLGVVQAPGSFGLTDVSEPVTLTFAPAP